MSDTPETDAAIKAQSEWKLPFVSYTMGGVTYDGPVASLCRRLERERDEAREQNAKLRDIADSAVWRMENGVCLPDASAVRAIKEEGLRLRAELNQLKEGAK